MYACFDFVLCCMFGFVSTLFVVVALLLPPSFFLFIYVGIFICFHCAFRVLFLLLWDVLLHVIVCSFLFCYYIFLFCLYLFPCVVFCFPFTYFRFHISFWFVSDLLLLFPSSFAVLVMLFHTSLMLFLFFFWIFLFPFFLKCSIINTKTKLINWEQEAARKLNNDTNRKMQRNTKTTNVKEENMIRQKQKHYNNKKGNE